MYADYWLRFASIFSLLFNLSKLKTSDNFQNILKFQTRYGTSQRYHILIFNQYFHTFRHNNSCHSPVMINNILWYFSSSLLCFQTLLFALNSFVILSEYDLLSKFLFYSSFEPSYDYICIHHQSISSLLMFIFTEFLLRIHSSLIFEFHCQLFVLTIYIILGLSSIQLHVLQDKDQ